MNPREVGILLTINTPVSISPPMIDLHLHLLPGVDDGAATLEVSRAMLNRAEGFGYTSLVATPHLNGRLTPQYEQHVRAALATVREAATPTAIAVELGYEIQLSPDLPRRMDAGERSRLADSTTVLVELPFSGWPLFTEQTLFELQTLGLRTLLAHPERYAAVQSEPERALELVERGVLLQVTTGSLVGLFGKPAQRVAELLMREGAATVLASDAHGDGHRFVSVKEGLERARELVGEARLTQLVYDNPKALLESRPLPVPAAMNGTSPLDDQNVGWRKALTRATSRLRN